MSDPSPFAAPREREEESPSDVLQIAESLIRRGGVLAVAGRLLRDRVLSERTAKHRSRE